MRGTASTGAEQLWSKGKKQSATTLPSTRQKAKATKRRGGGRHKTTWHNHKLHTTTQTHYSTTAQNTQGTGGAQTGRPTVRERKKIPTPRKRDATTARYSSWKMLLLFVVLFTSYTKNWPENTMPIRSSSTASWLYMPGLSGGWYTSCLSSCVRARECVSVSGDQCPGRGRERERKRKR